MEVDEELPSADNSRCNSRASSSGGRFAPSPLGLTRTVQGMVLNRGLGLRSHTGEFAVPAPPGSSATLPHPSKLMLSGRRSSSGIFLSNMFSSRFRHLQKLHTDAFLLGLNGVAYPGLPKGTMFRSSLPATPVSTPILREGFQHFTEQALKERLCKTPSPRKNRGFSPSSSHSSHHQQQQQHHHHPHQNYLSAHHYHQSPSSSSKVSTEQLNYLDDHHDTDDSYSSDHQMDTTSPVPPTSVMDDPLIEGGSDLSESESISLPSISKRATKPTTKDQNS
ncbi:uncharacterized protein LOC128395622 [Panonychus citri]|uniref:uncharacterized protein LOC128395622 n=1 Tax=Panonychus citri TaxID=50023 RepID=UPI002307788C|nr:uncharacterized protein LOC128395622 [Panonychus citri]